MARPRRMTVHTDTCVFIARHENDSLKKLNSRTRLSLDLHDYMDELKKLAKRRASNRQSQQRARDAKEAELNALRAENERLRSLYASV